MNKNDQGIEKLKDRYWIYCSEIDKYYRGADAVELIVEVVNNIQKDEFVNGKLLRIDTKFGV